MTLPQVSILLPLRDAASILGTALRSLQRQTLSNFEVLAVDDGSRDHSPQILSEWAARDRRIRPLSSGGAGLVAALELARQKACAPLLARMDADDVSHPERLCLQVRHLRNRPDLCGTGSKVRLFPRGGLRVGWRRYERWTNSLLEWQDLRRERYVESPLVHPSAVLRAAAVEQAGGYRQLPWPEDYDLFLRLLERGERLDKIDRTLLFWRNHPGRSSFTDPRYGLERHREMKLHHLLQGPLRGKGELCIWGAGRNGRRWARLLQARSVRLTAFIDIDPKKIGRRLQGVPVLSPEAARDPALPFMLGAVASPGARPLIRSALVGAGKIEERDFLFVQ